MNIIGQTLGGRYEIISEIGSGGMATVYEARCNKLKRHVAVKILKPEFQNNEEFLSRFRSESHAIAKLSHPNIVSIYDVGEDKGFQYIVMELVNGISLKEYIHNNVFLPYNDVLNISEMICRALQHAHKLKVIHRDVKSQNIIIFPDKFAKITDFGIAQSVTDSTMVVDRSASLGSVHYMAPEQTSGGFVDFSSDIYSLGIVMYEMLTGHLPFEGENVVSIAMKHLKDELPPISNFNIKVPVVVENIVKKATHKQKSQRYQSADEMFEEIQKVKRFLNKDFKDLHSTMPVSHARPLIESYKQVERNVIRDSKQQIRNKPVKMDGWAGFGIAIASLLLVAIIGFSIILMFFPNMFKQEQKVSEIVVPNLVGQTIEQMKLQYQSDQDIKISVSDEIYNDSIDKGKIIYQNPPAEKNVKPPIDIEVIVSRGKKEFMIPDFSNQSKDQVLNELAKLGLSANLIEQQNESVPEGYVIKTNPSGGNIVKSTSVVTVYVSKGVPKEIQVPSFIGMNLDAVKANITNQKLAIGTIREVNDSRPKDTIIAQSITQYKMVPEFSVIDFTVSSGNSSAKDLFVLPVQD